MFPASTTTRPDADSIDVINVVTVVRESQLGAMTQENVLVVGAGPVGLTIALGLARAGVDVTVVERGSALNTSPRAAVYHWCVVDYLAELGVLADAEERRLEARDLAEALGLPIGNAVDFWTEASLFSAAGLTALVYGPGDIAQAHAADEWVEVAQLEAYAESVVRILGGRA